jgi:hypothetical protein
LKSTTIPRAGGLNLFRCYKLACHLYVFTCIVSDLFDIEGNFKPVIDPSITVIGLMCKILKDLSRQLTHRNRDYRNVCQTRDLPVFNYGK